MGTGDKGKVWDRIWLVIHYLYVKTIAHPLVTVSPSAYATRRKAQEPRTKDQGCAVLCCTTLG